jgi:hypothetical protein
MFQFPGLPRTALCIQTGAATMHAWTARFPHSDILGSNARLAAPRGLSQPPTSFIGFWRQGIHRVPFLTWQHQDNNTHTRCSRSLCSSQPHQPASATRHQPTTPTPWHQPGSLTETNTLAPASGTWHLEQRHQKATHPSPPAAHPASSKQTQIGGHSLGAQQCARHPPVPAARSHPPDKLVTVLAQPDEPMIE